MNNEEQKLVGYIVYDIWTFNTKRPQDTKWEKNVIQPHVHWRKKIYETLTSAENAVKDITGSDNLHKAVIIPIYANRSDFDVVRETWKELKEEVNKINNNE